MRRQARWAFVAGVLLGCAAVASAQDGAEGEGNQADAARQQAYRQTVVVTAAATPVELGSVTRALTVITRDQIDKLPVHTIADVLRLTSSIDVRARGERGVQTDFSVRGASFGQMLVLVNGVRLNDLQSGHHNGDIPVPLEAVERIEVLHGPGSSLFGADAFGGTVNVITRETAGRRSLTVDGGSFGRAGASGVVGLEGAGVTQVVSAALDRSSGFMYDRDYKTAALYSRTRVGATGLSVSYLWKEFGANNFYGGNAPSREWTNQTLVAIDRKLGSFAAWDVQVDGSYRTHGDRFVFNQENPRLSDNRHRTHSAIASIRGSRESRYGTFTLGAEGGGDWIRSSNLGDHTVSRASGFGEWRRRIGSRAELDASLRVDRYSEFGAAWNPAVGVGVWPAAWIRLRGSAGRAYRIPSFTERYYSDPANLARPGIGPETAWAGEGGADLFLPHGWMVHTTVFGRADHDVIDWLRPTPADRWQTYNVRDVGTLGFEVSAERTFAAGAFMQLGYTALDLDAAEVTQISKYLLEYAPHSIVAAGSLPLPGRLRLAPRLEYRRRSRPGGTHDDVLLDARLGRRIGSLYELVVEGTNLFDVSYEEIAGVRMPGAAMGISLVIRTE